MSTSVNEATGRARGIPPEGLGGFSQCWYPVALSDEVGSGQVIGRDFLDGRVVVYRGEDGNVRVQSAYCRHLGADLSVGEVRGDELVCAFHHWGYGSDGMCTKIPAGGPIPRQAKLFSYPSEEALGLVWAFNGEIPLYPLPNFPGRSTDSLTVRAIETRRWSVPPYVLLTNSMDFQHLRELHGMKFDFDPADIVMDGQVYEFQLDGDLPNFGMLRQHIKCFGNNCITMTMSAPGGIEILGGFAGTPTGTGCRGFNIAASQRQDDETDDAVHADALTRSQMLMKQLQDEDAPVMDTIRFREDVLIEADRALSKFFRYVRDFPRAHPGDGFIN